MTPDERQALLRLATVAAPHLHVWLPKDADLIARCQYLEQERIFRRIIDEPDHLCFERVAGAPLLDLMLKHETDKALHRFDRAYGFFLGEDRRHHVRSVLELGIKKGASLRVWEEYFPQARIFGIDLDWKFTSHPKFTQRLSARTRTFHGSQTDETVLAEVCAAAGSFDLIIDDASHRSDDQVASLRYLWPFLQAPGVYVIEDTHAHAKYPEAYGAESCRYLPMSEMLAREVGRRLVEEISQSPGICAYEGMALLLKGEDGPPPDFDRYRKDA